ncbi:butyrophilin subfamily 1 member A1 isoform X2 [Ornithorhynchus anatinus]|uniref:butyrophilin subfamily 1 member A1 isoform X2 n=1 Tax=Ornithorhynchus anatinus TaxID=9258 RepID=UPI0010A8FFBD|nr:butyrophilin subfamily 1 member A1 isoform X2 [Ornithorhynchus anatinus]
MSLAPSVMEMGSFLASPLSCCLISLFQLSLQNSAQMKVIGPGEPIVVHLGDDVELPCHLEPKMNAQNMEVRWLRSQLFPAVHVYRDGQDQAGEQMGEYRGRTELLKDAINDGSLTVKIRDVRVSDDGGYRCLFRDDEKRDEATLQLQVTAPNRAGAGVPIQVSSPPAVGSDPHIRLEGHEVRGIRLGCMSTGWYPEPQVRWTDASGETVPSLSESLHRAADGLFSVSTSVFVRDDTVGTVSCSVQNPLLRQVKGAELSIAVPSHQQVSTWVVVLSVIVIILVLLIVGASYLIWMLHREKEHERTEKEKERMLNESFLAKLTWREARSYMVDITLDPDTAHPQLIVSEDRKSVARGDTRQDLPDNLERYDRISCVLAREGFTSGRHYWEVEVGVNTGWGLGVTVENLSRKGIITPRAVQKFWVVGFCGEEYWALTYPKTSLFLSQPLHCVGVYLDYEAGYVSFYSGTDGSHIYTFSHIAFSGTLRPLFHLWTEDPSPLTICSVPREAEGNWPPTGPS